MKSGHDRATTLGSAAGVIVGLLWIAMALGALWSSGQGVEKGRADWALAWGLVGILLLVAGCSAVAGSVMHRNHVRDHDAH
jgi:peptidoglycan/LPS O-acetylase OafA/YrhL